jgi:fumarylacetoacetate (FAA) hydrolase
MKLASLKEGGRDGTLIVVARDLKHAVKAAHIAPTLQAALEDWATVEPQLKSLYRLLNEGNLSDAVALEPEALAAPLPRAHQFLDGSAYLNHAELVRKARGAELPPSFYTDPMMYQAVSDGFLGPTEDISLASAEWGIDFEAELTVVLDDVPMGIKAADAGRHIKLFMLVNDVSLRGLIPAELAKGFGFVASKPRSALSPVAVTADEFGDAWDGALLHLPLTVHLNGKKFGEPDVGADCYFTFARLIEHAAQSRPLAAGTIIGSGTVSNRDRSVGSCCIAEQRTLETIDGGKPVTPYMAFGDRVRIEMLDRAGRSIFGAIDQKVVKYAGP